MEKNMTVNDKFVRNMQQKFNTKQVDKPEVKRQTMEGIMKSLVQVPEKLHMVSHPDTISVKPAKEGENKHRFGNGKDMFESTMNK